MFRGFLDVSKLVDLGKLVEWKHSYESLASGTRTPVKERVVVVVKEGGGDGTMVLVDVCIQNLSPGI